MHYQRFMKFGDPLAGGTKYTDPDDAVRFRSIPNGDCIDWTGSCNGKGYPRMNIRGRLVLVYRYVWERENGPVPKGLEVDHRCFNRACIKLAHLRLLTKVGNARHRSGPQPNSISGVRNVHRKGNRWIVRLKSAGKSHHFGGYATIEEAEQVAIAKRREMFGAA